MATITLDRPASAPAQPPAPSGVWLTGLRVVLLLVLAVSAVAALPSARPTAASAARFVADLQSGSVASVRFLDGKDEVRWSTGWSSWYRADLSGPLPTLPRSPDGMSAGGITSEYGASYVWLERALDATNNRRIDEEVIEKHERLSWAAMLPSHDLSAAAGGAALAGFFVMLINGGARFGNRWAWFWVMLATSGLGVVLYLALEPSPVWQRPSRQRPLPLRPRFLGGAGVLMAIALKPALAVLALLVSGS
jgi:hypothetical protein